MPVISKRFADELNEKQMRAAYLDAQTRAKLAQQIRALRVQRGWLQRDLGERMGKPQGNIARLEDSDVARYTLTTLLDLASAFDVGLVAKFVAYEDFLKDTQNLSPSVLQVKSFDRSALAALTEDPQNDMLRSLIFSAPSPVIPIVSHALGAAFVFTQEEVGYRHWRGETPWLDIRRGPIPQPIATPLQNSTIYQVRLPHSEDDVIALRRALVESERQIAELKRELEAVRADRDALHCAMATNASQIPVLRPWERRSAPPPQLTPSDPSGLI
jgi:transcriptional regulator with XRE-family HTH domain